MIEDELAQVEQRLQQIVETAGPEITEVGSYIFNGTGKRMRPTLFLLAAYQPQKSLFPYIDAAVALELIHTASLLHDDVIDLASRRRGKETVHVNWTNKISVLTGDYLLSQAFRMLVGYRDWRLMEAVVGIVQNMTEGEIEQAFAEPALPNLEERYFKWIGKKSASFFAGCCRAGSLISSADVEEQDNWSEFGYNLGISFQLIDDLLDYIGEGEKIGKPVYGDLSNRVMTLPLIRTIDQAKKDGSIHRLLEGTAGSDHNLSEVVQAVLDSDGPQHTYRKAEEYIRKAENTLNKFRHITHDVKEVLIALSKDVLNRKK